MEDDAYCRRVVGAVPFKWEVCPGTPKHTRSASAAVVSAKKLTPPPSMASSPTPCYYRRHCYSSSSPRVSSASVSPSRRRRPMTAFIDAAPRASTEYAAVAAPGTTVPESSAFGCFSFPMLRRKGSKKGGGGSSSSSSVSSFRSDGGGRLGLRRSVSISSSSSSSLPLPPGTRFAEARREVEAATGSGWFC